MAEHAGTTPAQLTDLGGEGLPLLAEAVLALRTTGDLSVAWTVAASAARRALGTTDSRLLRVDSRSGALFRWEESAVETPYLAEHGGPVEWVMRHDRALFDDGTGGGQVPRETLLWRVPPQALVTVPLTAGHTHYGFLLLAFDRPTSLDAPRRLFVQTLADALALALERADAWRTLSDARARASELERRLARSQESTSALLAVVSHEVRSPLSAVKAYAETLADNLDNPRAPRERFLRIIDEECDRLAKLVGDVHDLSRIEGGECPLRLSSLTIEGLARELRDAYAGPAARRGLSLSVEVESDVSAEADGELVRRVLANLIGNALQFSPEAGHVGVRFSSRADEWLCAVTDEGPELPAEDLTVVFEGFYRARRAVPEGGSETEWSGTRLGLAISRGIVQLHGGRMWAEQAGPNGGARFCFAMPTRPMASPRARRIARQIVTREDLRGLFDAIVEMVGASLDSDIVSLMTVDPDRGDLFVIAAHGLDPNGFTHRRTPLRSGVSGAAAAWGRPLLVENIETDRRFKRLNHPQYRTKSLLCVPLRVEGEVVGVVNVNNKVSGDAFDEDDLALLTMLVERVGSAIERACALPESPRVVDDALDAVRCMTRLKRDLALGGRSMMKRARAVARELGMSAIDVDIVGYVASIHDLGMVRLETHIAHPNRLDEAQRNALTTHPAVSIEILRPLEYLGVVRDLILAHHERWDGTGYPHQLEGERIPLGARILAVVDAWDSMTSVRPYRLPRPVPEAIEELRRQGGFQFDPDVVEAFLRVADREGVTRTVDWPAAA